MEKSYALGDIRTIRKNGGRHWQDQQLTSHGWVDVGQPTPFNHRGMDPDEKDHRQSALYSPLFFSQTSG